VSTSDLASTVNCLKTSLAKTRKPVRTLSGCTRNIWHVARDDPFTYKTVYDSFYDSFVYKNTERIQDTILLILIASLDIYLKNTSCNFYQSVCNYCLIWHVLFAEFKQLVFSFVAGQWSSKELSQKKKKMNIPTFKSVGAQVTVHLWLLCMQKGFTLCLLSLRIIRGAANSCCLCTWNGVRSPKLSV
jgi:hypothetical protein